MMESENPYRAPLAADLSAPMRDGQPLDRSLLVTWTVVFAINVVIPLLLGWMMTEKHGRLGMCLAVAGFLGAGWVLCYTRPAAARRIVLGAMFTAVSQLFPIIQIISGGLAVEITAYVETVVLGARAQSGPISSEMGGFLATFLVGCCLLCCAEVIGLIATYVLPGRGAGAGNAAAPEPRFGTDLNLERQS